MKKLPNTFIGFSAEDRRGDNVELSFNQESDGSIKVHYNNPFEYAGAFYISPKDAEILMKWISGNLCKDCDGHGFTHKYRKNKTPWIKCKTCKGKRYTEKKSK